MNFKKILVGILLAVVIPSAVALLGFFVIAPQLGKVPVIESQAQKVATLAGTTLAGAGPKKEEVEPPPQPKIKVEVEGEVTRRRQKNREAEVEVLSPGRPKSDEAAGADSPLPPGDREPDPEGTSGSEPDGGTSSDPSTDPGSSPTGTGEQTPGP